MINEYRIVHTCGICEEICEAENLKNHSCLEGYNNYLINENTIYFYPVLDNGTAIIRRSAINNEKKIMVEPFQQAYTSAATSNKIKTHRRTSKFNFNDEETLILEVRNRSALWNYSLPLKERNLKIKKQLWEEIAQIFNRKFSVEELKLKFKSLHDTFRKIIHSEHQVSGSTRKNFTTKWPHYQSMQYLRDPCLDKTTMFNIEIDERNRTLNTSINDDDVESILPDNGTTIIRRGAVNNEEKIVTEPFQRTTRSAATSNKIKTHKRTSKFNFDDEETLILEVQNRPALWNYSLPLKERNGKIKKQLWEEIAQILNRKFSVEELKLKFKSLHDTFRKIIHSEHQASGSTRKNFTTKWPHYQSMQYLRDPCLDKTRIFNIEIDEKKRISNTSINDDDVESILPDSTERRKKPRNEGNTNGLERITLCQSNNDFFSSPPSVPDEIDSFLSSVGHRLRRMPSREQLDIMQQIFDITYRALIKNE
ncbi:uncharacterized protein LOC105200446 isoform X2 [Solenopsis invicta]|uniref:uncharacterized protein LOC105200446 isoform X2 n=1 Tax=Solenopsis invicta TaxID=13686 RepID=UPI0005963AC6|nr:uncharacterized protein LOC105200446 isoform X2 [Solenopsis invicta]